MKRVWPLFALGVGAYIIFALVTLPASVVLSRLGSTGIQAGGVSGTIWNGRAQVLQLQGVHIGSAEWQLHVLPLFTAHINADVKITRIDGFATTQVSARPGGTIELENLTASLPLTALPVNAFPIPIPDGWTATLNARFAQLQLDDGWPTQLDGTVDIVDLTGPERNPSPVGDYRLVFDPAASSADVQKGALTDAGNGPLQITGTLELRNDRSYKLEGLIAARPDAPRNIVQVLQFLGPPDEQGRRVFVTEGTM